ncbi:MFS transporter [Desulfosporosinus sp. OT]|uniref:MFS transporter n=1 Tax=Desulfosporosinus sp. OT TaxID=913865 RepID=UPI0002F0E96B|nr:MFS transporter [Desulfosporosinus sp. OT]
MIDKQYELQEISSSHELKSFSNFLLLLVATIFFTSTYYILLPVLPLYLESLGGNYMQIGFVMGIFSISSLILRPISGSFTDRMGRKTLLYASIIVFLCTPLFYILTPSLLLASLTQIFYGFSVGAFTVASTTMATDLTPDEKITQYVGIFSLAFVAAKGFAPAIGNLLFIKYGFHGALLFSWFAGLLSLLLLIPVKGPRFRSSNPNVHFSKMLFDFRVQMPMITLFCGMVTFGIISNWLSTFATNRGIVNVSLFFFINTAFMIISRLFTAKITIKGLPRLTVLTGVLMIVSIWLIAGVTQMWQLALVGIVYGIGYGAYYPTLTSIVVLSVDKEERGTALGIYTTAFDLGVTAGSVLGGLSHYFGFVYVFWGITIIPILGLVYFWHQHRRLQALV